MPGQTPAHRQSFLIHIGQAAIFAPALEVRDAGTPSDPTNDPISDSG